MDQMYPPTCVPPRAAQPVVTAPPRETVTAEGEMDWRALSWSATSLADAS